MNTLSTRKLFLYIAMSLDGFIARKDGNLDWLNTVQMEGEDYGYNEFIQKIDTVILGRKTYEKVMTMVDVFPHEDKECYVWTKELRTPKDNVIFYNGNLAELVTKLKTKEGKHIFCDGGAEIIHELLSSNLIDEMIISIIPILLGDGVRLFKSGLQEIDLQLIESKNFPSGLVQLHYKRRV
jgi:dihydrofolate reductase